MAIFRKFPFLFIGFKVRHTVGGRKCRYRIDKIRGVTRDASDYVFITDKCVHPARDCELVARAIEDMTPAEINKAIALGGLDWDHDIFRRHWEPVTPAEFMYLVSIGVYPGPREDFYNGTVRRDIDGAPAYHSASSF